LTPILGYDQASKIALEAYRTGKTIREIVLEAKLLPEDQLETLFREMHVGK
jgi:aspartate ammonia-lyase